MPNYNIPSQIIFTAIPRGPGSDASKPNGLAMDIIRVSLLISPKLFPSSPKILGDFPDFLQWPDKLATLGQLKLHLNVAGQIVTLSPSVAPTLPNSSNYWENLFPQEIPVLPYKNELFNKADNKKPEISSTPAAALAIRQLRQLESKYWCDPLDQSNLLTLQARVNAALNPVGGNPKDSPITAVVDLVDRTLRAVLDPCTKPSLAELDFQGIIAGLANHPDMLRRLGLLVDLEYKIPSADFNVLNNVHHHQGTLKIEPTNSSTVLPIVSVVSMVQLDLSSTSSGCIMERRPHDDLTDRGFIQPTNFSLLQGDVEGTVHKLFSLNASGLPWKNGGLPAERTPGFTLVHNNVEKYLEQCVDDLHNLNDDLQQNHVVTVDELNLRKGFTLEFAREGEVDYRNICKRETEIEFNLVKHEDIPFPLPPIHGPFPDRLREVQTEELSAISLVGKYVDDNPIGRPNLINRGASGNTLRAYQIVARNGSNVIAVSSEAETNSCNVSLDAANFVHLTWRSAQNATVYDVYRTKSNGNPSTVGKIGSVATTSFDDIGFAGDGALPPASKVGIGLSDAMFVWDGRSPSVQLDSAVETDRFCTKEIQYVLNYAIWKSFNIAKKSLTPLRFGNRYKCRVRPVNIIGDDFVAQTCKLPSSDGGDTDALFTDFFRRCEPVSAPNVTIPSSQDSASGSDALKLVMKDGSPNLLAAFIKPPTVSQQMAEWHGTFDAFSPEYIFDRIISRLISDGQPNFPDPMAKGVLVKGLPGRDEPLLVKFPGTSYVDKLDGFKIVMHDSGTRDERFQLTGRTLNVYIKGGYSRTLTLSSWIEPSDYHLFSAWFHTTEQAMSEADPKAFIQNAENSIQMGWDARFGASVNIELINAVRKPLFAPSITKPNPNQKESSGLYERELILDGISLPSTSSIQIQGKWTDYEYAPETSEGYMLVERDWQPLMFSDRQGSPLRTDICIDGSVISDVIPVVVGHTLGDNRARIMKLRAVATSKYQEYYQRTQGNFSITGQEFSIDPHQPEIRKSSVKPLPLNLRRCKQLVLHSKKSASKKLDSHTLRRRIRLYFDGPWFSSGVGEKFAVILPAQVTNQIAARKVSKIGLDPAHPDGECPNFSVAGTVSITVPVSELNQSATEAETVTLATCDPKFDQRKKLFFVDLEIQHDNSDKRGYNPFVKLCVARYQPNGEDGVRVSDVSTLAFKQLGEDRFACVTLNDDSTVKVEVQGKAYHHSDPTCADKGKTAEMRLYMERFKSFAWRPFQIEDEEFVSMDMHCEDGATIWSTTRSVEDIDLSLNRFIVREYEKLHSANDGATRLTYVDVLQRDPLPDRTEAN